jgi:DNA-binding NtrC family response regulator
LRQPEYHITEAADGRAALDAIRSLSPDLVFLDLNMPELDGKAVLRELGPATRNCEIIVLTAIDSVATAVECIRLGAADFITKPYEVEQLRAIARRVAERTALQSQVLDLQQQLAGRQALGALVGISRPMRELYSQMTRAAGVPADILICGETGTGKELIAREIHRLSDRAAGPFVAVNTAAIPESLTESELFGHVRGAFTGAEGSRRGVFEQAQGGTLFLDEIGDMPLPAQTKILRVLQERVVQAVGSTDSLAVDVRVISATHQDLQQAIGSGRFRQDLYYRIRGVELRVPPLRSRREDILLLANYFLEQVCQQSQRAIAEFSTEAVAALLAHTWPGNVRELQQMVRSAAAMGEGPQLTASDLGLSPAASRSESTDWSRYAGLPLAEARAQLVADFEQSMIQRALDQQGGNVSAAARQLGMHRQSLQQKMAALKIRVR